jgi:hypothetical protein
MNPKRFLLALLACSSLALAYGCGRLTRPGEYFEGKKVETSIAPKSTTPLPEKSYFEFGPDDAKVRILAFFPIDEPHNDLMNLLKGLVSEYQGKVYLKYTDPRTPEGNTIMQRSQMRGCGLLINGVSEMTIKAKPEPYHVELLQDMGRYWTAEDLRAAVAQTVAESYGGPAPLAGQAGR